MNSTKKVLGVYLPDNIQLTDEFITHCTTQRFTHELGLTPAPREAILHELMSDIYPYRKDADKFKVALYNDGDHELRYMGCVPERGTILKTNKMELYKILQTAKHASEEDYIDFMINLYRRHFDFGNEKKLGIRIWREKNVIKVEYPYDKEFDMTSLYSKEKILRQDGMAGGMTMLIERYQGKVFDRLETEHFAGLTTVSISLLPDVLQDMSNDSEVLTIQTTTAGQLMVPEEMMKKLYEAGIIFEESISSNSPSSVISFLAGKYKEINGLACGDVDLSEHVAETITEVASNALFYQFAEEKVLFVEYPNGYTLLYHVKDTEEERELTQEELSKFYEKLQHDTDFKLVEIND